MDAVKAFNEELSGIYETKPPISRAKMTLLTKKAIKGIKFYKHIVQSVEKFIQKCRPEYKVPGLYVMDSVVRQSRHQFGPEKDVFMPRLCKNMLTTFQHIYKCPQEDKPRVLRVLNLWQKNNVFPQDIVQQLMVMGGAPTPGGAGDLAAAKAQNEKSGDAPTDPTNLTNILANLIANPDAGKIQSLAGLLSSSQQNQLQELLQQVKGNEQLDVEIEEEVVEEYMDTEHGNNIPPAPDKQRQMFQQPPSSSAHQPPFLAQQSMGMNQNQPPHKPSFNRAVLDYDYSDDEQTPPNNVKINQQNAIDPALLAKLPTPDQIHQLTAPNGGIPHRLNPDEERRRRLEEEQENFNKEIQEMSSRSRDRSEGSQRSNRRRHSRSKSRDRRHHRRGSPSHDRGHRSRRSRSRSRDRSGRRSKRSRSKSRERRRANDKGLPPVREGCYSVCTTTLWIGNISSKVMQHELQGLVEEYGPVESINMIPPRGCAYICMKQRADASKALYKIRHARMGGKSLKCDWAPSKEMPEDQKPTWVKEDGVNYVPVTPDHSQLRMLTLWGFVDPETVPADKKAEFTALTAPAPEANQAELKDPVEPMVPPQAMVPQQMMATPIPPASFGIPPAMQMAPRPSMQMLMRPGFPVAGMNPFEVRQRLGMPPQQQQQPPEVKPELKVGETTPTRDEQGEEAPRQPQQAFPPHFAPASMAQRFPGQMPVIQMMPGGMMQPRMGVMPIRMGVPMQLRPGFHPAMGARMQFPGGPQMMAGPMQPQLRAMHQLPPQQGGGFPGAMRLRLMQVDAPPPQNPAAPLGMPPRIRAPMHPEMDIEREVPTERPDDRPSVEKPPPREPEDRPTPGRPDDFPHPRETPRDFDRPPPDFNRQRSFESDNNQRPAERGGGRPPFDRDRERRFDRERNFDRGFSRGDRFRGDRDMEWGGRGRGRGGDRRNFDRDRRDRGGRDFDRDRNGPPPRDFDRRDRDRDGRGRGPPWGGSRGRGGDDRGWRGRGGGPPRGNWGRDGGSDRREDRRDERRDEGRRRSPFDPEEEEYQRKRQETLKRRREGEDDYVAENVNLASFGLPSGFGDNTAPTDEGAPTETKPKTRVSRWSAPNEPYPDKSSPPPATSDETEAAKDLPDNSEAPQPQEEPPADAEPPTHNQPSPPPAAAEPAAVHEEAESVHDIPMEQSPGTPTHDEQAKVKLCPEPSGSPLEANTDAQESTGDVASKEQEFNDETPAENS